MRSPTPRLSLSQQPKNSAVRAGLQARPQGAPQGFTLPELAVVGMLVALLSMQALPAIAKGWEGLMYARMGNTILMVINSVRQHAITSERDTLIEFQGKRWCARFADADADSCGLGSDELPSNFRFFPRVTNKAQFLFTAGRGFSPLSSLTLPVGNYNTHAAQAALYIVNSSVGRVRICTTITTIDVPKC